MKYLLKFTAVSICFLLAFGLAAADEEIERHTAQISAISSQLQERQRAREQLLQTERAALGEVRAGNRQLTNILNEIQRLNRDIASSNTRLQNITERKQQLIQAQEIRTDSIINALCLYNKKLLTVPQTENPLAHRIIRQYLKYSKNMYLQTAKELYAAETEAEQISGISRDLAATRQARQTASTQTRRQIDEYNRQRRENARRIAAAEREIQELRESARELQALVARLAEAQRQRAAAARPSANIARNSLPWPVDGTITTRFGRSRHPQLDTYVISNGIRIRSAEGAVVNAVADGTVLFAGQFRAYGRMVIVDHGNGFFSIYGQLASISVRENQTIARGATIGRLGRGDANVLYFEVRENQAPVNPTLWLRQRQ
ncbi:MAG: peptidoglycan DD-metalloendopeptidase family protein [Elusimicrobia bacterium]|nr:peptidoglycan DD-metalloendopeptidase family protein [Elusimicrobiota bacterium]